MWPFRKHEAQAVQLDELAYSRWLRAQRPEFRWFLALPADEQEVLAALGDQYVADLHLALSYALKDPQVAELGAKFAAGDESAELSLLQKVAQREHRATMGGLGARKAQRETAKRVAKDSGRSFLGRRPDPVEAT